MTFACESTAVPDCCRICRRVSAAVSAAKSASSTREREPSRFSTVTRRLLIVCSKRLTTAPKLARAEVTVVSAASIAPSASVDPASANVETSTAEILLVAVPSAVPLY